MDDCLIIGGGVIGLSLAYTLADGGWRVRVVDRGQPGARSLLGRGRTHPAAPQPAESDAAGTLDGARVAVSIPNCRPNCAAETGIDNGYLPLRRHQSGRQVSSLPAWRQRRRSSGVFARTLKIFRPQAVVELEPAFQALLRLVRSTVRFCLPEETQFRNPRHCMRWKRRADSAASRFPPTPRVEDFDFSGGEIHAARTEEWPARGEAILHYVGHLERATASAARIAADRQADPRPDRALEVQRTVAEKGRLYRAPLLCPA